MISADQKVFFKCLQALLPKKLHRLGYVFSVSFYGGTTWVWLEFSRSQEPPWIKPREEDLVKFKFNAKETTYQQIADKILLLF